MKNRFYDKSQWDAEVAVERAKNSAIWLYYGTDTPSDEIHEFIANTVCLDARSKAKPCPFCGGTSLSFKYDIHYGHGDSSFDKGRIECNRCKGSKGNVSNYGTPTANDEIKAYEQWNNRYINNINTKENEE